MSKLSNRTLQIVHSLYISREAKEICDMLEFDCCAEKVGASDWTQNQMERIWFAVLKVVDEDLLDFDTAIKLAQTDWRDLLISAGFADSLDAHIKWAGEIGN